MERKYWIDFLKVVATVLIIFHHYQQLVGVFFEGTLNFYNGKFYFGLLVELFFVLSGFVVVKYIEPIRKGMSFPVFWGKRYFRLVPMTALAAVVYSILGYFFCYVGRAPYEWKFLPVKLNLWGTIQTAIGMQVGGIFPAQQINNPTWYISVLLICYVFFYLIVRVSQKRGFSPLYLFFVMVFMGLAIGTHSINLPLLDTFTRRGYYSFFFGLILGSIYDKRNSTKKEALAATGICMALVAFVMYKESIEMYAMECLMTFVMYPAIIVIFNSNLMKRIFSHRIWGVLSSISFNAYIWHVNVLLAIYVVLSMGDYNIDIKSWYGMLLYTALSFWVGAISHYCLEKNITKLLFERWKVVEKLEQFFKRV